MGACELGLEELLGPSLAAREDEALGTGATWDRQFLRRRTLLRRTGERRRCSHRRRCSNRKREAASGRPKET
jgi:hypothetical protein